MRARDEGVREEERNDKVRKAIELSSLAFDIQEGASYSFILLLFFVLWFNLDYQRIRFEFLTMYCSQYGWLILVPEK